MILKVSEIVSSLQGEGKFTGYPTTFLRLYGCNLNCSYCDTRYAMSMDKVKRMSVDSVLSMIFRMSNAHVCITGGEPLLQPAIFSLIYELVEKGYKVGIETNGAVPIESSNYHRSFYYCMDIKCPSSGMSQRNVYRNLGELDDVDEVKFVICGEGDYVFAKGILAKYPTKAKIIFSPCFDNDGYNNSKDLAEWIHDDKLNNARLGMQMHRIIGIY